MENKHLYIIGQILTAIGLVLTAGGIASLYYPNVDLRFFNLHISTDKARTTWIIISALIGITGMIFWRIAKLKK